MDNIFEIKFTFEKKVREEVIYKFSNKQGGAYNIFSYHWQCFVWAAIIGFLRNEPRDLCSPLADKVFSLNTMKNNGGEKDAQALICLAIARYGSLDIMKDPNKAIELINKYANGGFYHIMKLMENGEASFNDVEQVKQEIFNRSYEDISMDLAPSDIFKENSEEEDVVENIESEEDTNSSNTTEEEDYSEEDDKPWTEYENELLTLCFNNGYDTDRIAEKLKRSKYSVKKQLAQLGFIELPLDVTVENTSLGGNVCSKSGEVLYSVDGQLKILNNKIYRFNLKSKCLTVKAIVKTGENWDKSGKMLVADTESDLFKMLSKNYIEEIEDFSEGEAKEQNKIKVNGTWYDYYGDIISSTNEESSHICSNTGEDSVAIETAKCWAAQEKRELESYYNAGLSVKQLAAFFGKDEDEVINVMKKMKLL